MMKKVLCTLLMAAFISPLWAAETEAAPEQKLMPAITADTGGRWEHDDDDRWDDDRWEDDDDDRWDDDRWEDDDDDMWDDDRYED